MNGLVNGDLVGEGLCHDPDALGIGQTEAGLGNTYTGQSQVHVLQCAEIGVQKQCQLSVIALKFQNSASIREGGWSFSSSGP